MSATQKFHRAANDALVKISEYSPAGSKLALVIYTPGEPEQDIILNPKRILHLDKKKGSVTVTKDQSTFDQETVQVNKPTRIPKVKRACDYDFYQD